MEVIPSLMKAKMGYPVLSLKFRGYLTCKGTISTPLMTSNGIGVGAEGIRALRVSYTPTSSLGMKLVVVQRSEGH